MTGFAFASRALPSFGRVVDFDLSQPLDDGQQQALRDLLYDNGLLVFRNQQLSDEDQTRVLGHFGHVLFGETLVGRDEQNIVERCGVVVEKLAVVQVQDERFAAARGHPEGEFFQVGFVESCIGGFGGAAAGVAMIDEVVEILQ